MSAARTVSTAGWTKPILKNSPSDIALSGTGSSSDYALVDQFAASVWTQAASGGTLSQREYLLPARTGSHTLLEGPEWEPLQMSFPLALYPDLQSAHDYGAGENSARAEFRRLVQQLLESPGPSFVFQLIVAFLQRWRKDGASALPLATEVSELTGDHLSQILRATASSELDLDTRRAAEVTISELLNSERASTRYAATEALAEHGTNSSKQALGTRLEKETNRTVRAAISAALSTM